MRAGKAAEYTLNRQDDRPATFGHNDNHDSAQLEANHASPYAMTCGECCAGNSTIVAPCSI